MIKSAKLLIPFLCLMTLLYLAKIDKKIREHELMLKEAVVHEHNVLCMVLTTEENLLTRSTAIWDTWGKEMMPNIVFACNCPHVVMLKDLLHRNETVPDELKKYLKAQQIPVLHLNVTESKTTMGLKVLAVLKRSFELFSKNMRFYFMVDDDTFVFADNLFEFLKTVNPNAAFMYGFKRSSKRLDFVFGGSGIVFTDVSMALLVERINKDGCKGHIHKFGDWTIGKCARAVGIQIGDTADEQGRPRFNAFSPDAHIHGPSSRKERMQFSKTRKIGKECCSLSSISFHYINATAMHAMHEKKFTFLREILI